MNAIYDLHTHTIHSDGILIPAESTRYAKTKGYLGIAITDHVDRSNLEHVLKLNLKFKESNNRLDDFKVIVGCEITHVLPNDIIQMTKDARELGADIVIVHGETTTEPVAHGTNLAAIEACVDILAHPGFITYDEALLAKKNNVALEITTRRGHSNTNAHVVTMAKKAGAKLVINNDAHMPNDYVGYEKAREILLGLSLNDDDIKIIIENNKQIFHNVLNKNK